MRFHRIVIVLSVMLVMIPSLCFPQNKLQGMKSWVCFYEDKFPENKVPIYDLYVLDKKYHPNLKEIKTKAKDSVAVGYISLGEVEKREEFFSIVKKKGLLVDENENWPNSYRVLLSSPEWHEIVLNKLIPEVLKQGFEGIFIDTIDTADYLESEKKLKGQKKGAVNLLKKIRKKYPKIIIVMNNGFSVVGAVGNQIDALVVEDIYTLYDFKKKKYNLAKKSWTNERLKLAKLFQSTFKKPVLPLEYLKSKDKRKIRKVAREALGEGFIPYISDIDLTKIFFNAEHYK